MTSPRPRPSSLQPGDDLRDNFGAMLTGEGTGIDHRPGAVIRLGHRSSGSTGEPSSGSMMARIGRSKARAKSKSRWSPYGTAMIAPVP